MPFKLTNQGEYAVRMMVYLAGRGEGERISAQEIASRQNIPQGFLRNIISEFVKKGFIRSFKGQGGGIELAPGGRERSLLEVIEAVEGPIYLNICMQGQDVCEFSGQCAVHEVWHEAQDSLQQILGSRSLGTLANRNTRLAEGAGIVNPGDLCGVEEKKSDA